MKPARYAPWPTAMLLLLACDGATERSAAAAPALVGAPAAARSPAEPERPRVPSAQELAVQEDFEDWARVEITQDNYPLELEELEQAIVADVR